MDRPNIQIPDASRVEMGQYDSVRTHVRQQVNDEVRKLERRIETLKLTQAPHAEIIISAYERMIERKRGFLQNWDM